MTANLRPPHCSDEDIASLIDGRHAHPKSVLGLHTSGREVWLTALLPGAEKASAKIGRKTVDLSQVRGPVFTAKVSKSKSAHVFEVTYADGSVVKVEDAYRFGQHIGELDLHLIGEGTHKRLWEVLGAHVTEIDGVAGTYFALWAPNAQRVSIIGGFNLWNGIAHPMERLGSSGVWELFIPGVSEGALYKYSVLDCAGQELEKADPVAFGSQHPPETASVVRDITGYGWSDSGWMDKRHAINRRDQPISIYEVHLGSWRRKVEEDGRRLSYKELAKELVEYASWMGFTHLEFLPVSEFPFDGSWGYQPVGLYAPTIRFGPPHEFRDLVDAAHNAGLGIILDWVPGHFPSDAHGLAEFDGTHLYEYSDPKEGFHQDWNTLIYNYGRTEVKNYLVANALYWLEEYHVDGLRVDAVASMLYRDYSRAAGEWVPNKDGGRENYEAIAFLQDMNVQAYGENAGIMTVAEESTAFPQVSSPVDAGGLGFGFKWNMGWMNDTLRYMEKDPVHRAYDHHLMTFGIDYAFTENFILPISHDEVVHGKGSMIEKMPGDPAQKLANLRAYYGYMWGHPGKKLLFMGCEFAQGREWNHDVSLDWDAAQADEHRGVQLLVRDLNRLYADTPALHRLDCDPSGFRWIANYPEQSILSFARFGEDGDAPAFVVCNFTPIERTDFRIGVPKAGRWIEKLNTDAAIYGGEDRGNLGEAATKAVEWDGFAQSVSLTIPPLSTLIFVCDD